jgi:molybdenum cofactor biosynthesis enzyme MoaA
MRAWPDASCVTSIWRIPRSASDLPLEGWVALLSSDLLSDLRELDITGGEPFLRDDLVSLFGTVCELKRAHLKRLESVAITTNGILTDRVVSMVRKMLEAMATRRARASPTTSTRRSKSRRATGRGAATARTTRR